MRVLDLFCGAGGAAMGLFRAGFDEIVGVDNRPQPRYPFMFVRGDALCPPVRLEDFDLIWASPPCQHWSPMVRARGLQARHPQLIESSRVLLRASGVPYVIENIPTSPVIATLVLSGCMFGMDTYRKRHFECSFLVLAPRRGRPFGPVSRPGSETIVGHSGGSSCRDGKGEYRLRGNLARWCEVMGIDWMCGRELVEAVPPAYAEFIGREFLRQRAARAHSC